MKILILNWKDLKHPKAGGAELVTETIARRLVKEGNKVTLFTAGFPDALLEENIEGVQIIRRGGQKTVYFRAFQYYRKHFKGQFDLVIDEVNTIPFFAKFYAKEKNILFIHQLCRKIWFYEAPFFLNLIGYLIEPFFLRLLKDRRVIVVSESTKNNLLKHGFKKENINIISEGIELKPLSILPSIQETKEKMPTILYLGSLRKMKRACHVIKAFEIAKKDIKNLRLWIAGKKEKNYFKKIMKLIDGSVYKKDIVYFNKVTSEKKAELLQKTHLICVTSVKEGWGLVVTEANSQGTPAIVYNVDGLRDSVRDNTTGLICQENTPKNLAKNIIYLLTNKEKYNDLRIKAWKWSKEINFENCYKDFINIINNL